MFSYLKERLLLCTNLYLLALQISFAIYKDVTQALMVITKQLLLHCAKNAKPKYNERQSEAEYSATSKKCLFTPFKTV